MAHRLTTTAIVLLGIMLGPLLFFGLGGFLNWLLVP
jgi:hypothetical protein